MASTVLRLLVSGPNDGVDAAPDGSGGVSSASDAGTSPATAPGDRTSESDDVAFKILDRFGRAPTEPVGLIQAALPDVVPGWLLFSHEFRQSVMASLVSAGLDPAMAKAIALE